MAIAPEVKSLFSSKIRGRGDAYFRAGAVNIVDRGQDWIEAEVDGSGGQHYAVILDLDPNVEDVYLDCTCPHFEDGFYCKHIWAAARAADAMGLLGSPPSRGQRRDPPMARRPTLRLPTAKLPRARAAPPPGNGGWPAERP